MTDEKQAQVWILRGSPLRGDAEIFGVFSTPDKVLEFLQAAFDYAPENVTDVFKTGTILAFDPPPLGWRAVVATAHSIDEPTRFTATEWRAGYEAIIEFSPNCPHCDGKVFLFSNQGTSRSGFCLKCGGVVWETNDGLTWHSLKSILNRMASPDAS